MNRKVNRYVLRHKKNKKYLANPYENHTKRAVDANIMFFKSPQALLKSLSDYMFSSEEILHNYEIVKLKVNVTEESIVDVAFYLDCMLE